MNNSPGREAAKPQANWKRLKKPYYLSLDPLIHWARVERPIDWAGEFGRTAPLEVEIGFGNGEALVRRAREDPDTNFVGLEVGWASSKRALRRLAKQKIENVRLLQLEAQIVFQRFFTQNSIDRVRSFFPIPWPKDKHESRRLFSTDFLRLTNSRLVLGGTVQIVTDFEPFMTWVLEQTPETGFSVARQDIPAGLDTKYERKWREEGQEIFFELTLTKTDHRDIPLTEDLILQNHRLGNFDPENFHPKDLVGPITVKFKDFLFDPQREKVMIRAFLVENRLVQEIWIKVVREGEEWVLGLDHGNHVVPTEGVKVALERACLGAES